MKREKYIDPSKDYAITVHYIEEDTKPGYYFAYHPDFGASAFSATGDTISDAIATLHKVRKEVVYYLAREGRKLPKPSPNPLDSQELKRCSTNCHFVTNYNSHYNTVRCSLIDSYYGVGRICPRPLEQFDIGTKACATSCHNATEQFLNSHQVRCNRDNKLHMIERPCPFPVEEFTHKKEGKWKCVLDCPQATVLKFETATVPCVQCEQDKQRRTPGVPCPHPKKVRDNTKKLDPITKFYLKLICKKAKSIPPSNTLDLVDELVTKAHRLQESVSPAHRKHYGNLDRIFYTTRIAAIALHLVTQNLYRACRLNKE